MRPKSNKTDIILGGKQLMIMQLIFRLGPEAYGGEMYRVLAKSGSRTLLPQIYRALDVLERKGLVKHKIVEPAGDKRGGLRKVYELTAFGERALAASLLLPEEIRNVKGWSVPGIIEGA